MNILVFDDNPIHRAAAQAQLADHNLTVVGTYDEAIEMLVPRFDSEKFNQILRDQFGDFSPFESDDEGRKAAYWAARDHGRKQAVTCPPHFDVVLTDFLVPASGKAQLDEGKEFVGQEMPIGIFIGLLAAVRGGAKYVAVFTDSDHHSHPASACFDEFNDTPTERGEQKPKAFTVEGSKVILCNNRYWVGQYDPKDLVNELAYREAEKRTDTVRAKNWAALLAYVTA